MVEASEFDGTVGGVRRRAALTATAIVLLIGLVTSACTGEASVDVAQQESTVTESPVVTTPAPSPAPSSAPTAAPPATSTPDTSPPPTTTPLAEATSTPVEDDCGPDPSEYKFEVVNVAPDDPDGGLITHAGPGVDTPELGVLAWDAGNLYYYECALAPNGVAWYQLGAGSELVWVNSQFVGDRRIAADSLAETPCLREQGSVFPSGSPDQTTGAVVVADIDVESSAECDRVVIEMGQGYENYDSIVTSLDPGFGSEFIETIEQSESEVLITLKDVEPFAFGVDVESWRDVATNEQNVALLMESYEPSSAVYVGWGTGDGYVRFAEEPTPRVIIDIFQTETPEGKVVGPIVGDAVLFDPVQEDLFSPGVSLPVTLRGWSRGFESSSVLQLAPWDENPESSPLLWEGVLFGSAAGSVFTDGVEFAQPLVDYGSSVWPFMTTGYFEITITDLEAGAYQFAIEPSSGCQSLGGVGQQFRLLGPDVADVIDVAPALPFSLQSRWVGDDFEQAEVVTWVLDDQVVGPAIDSPC